MTWFEELTGFAESHDNVREFLSVEESLLRSKANKRSWQCGELAVPTLAELRQQACSCHKNVGRLSVHEVVANVQQLHAAKSNVGAMFQVASQFNLLEMVSPEVMPEDGVGRYEHDRTQGPACAIAAGAGTIYRNYFARVNGQVGQTSSNQIDCLAGIGKLLGNAENRLWEMKNGYALATEVGLHQITQYLKDCGEPARDELRQALRIGIQWNTQVTLENALHLVSQAYCSALPVAYSHHAPQLWEEFARLVLEAAYEATICAAIMNATRTGNNRLYLTLLGGGAFGNHTRWITDAIRRACKAYFSAELDVAIVSYGSSKPHVQELIASLDVRR